MVTVIKRERLVPNIHLIEIHAPNVARKCRPGQFIIIMSDEKGERIPLSIADWDLEKGSVTSVFLIVGTSTHKLSLLNAGDEVPVFVGPLGRPSEIKKYGTVLCVGGCYGIGAVYPVARALKEAGNNVITLIEAKANYLFYWEEKLRAVSDQFLVSCRNNDFDCRDFIQRVIEDIMEENKIDFMISVGCTSMMYNCSRATKPYRIKTVVNLNPVMVDGTGMCGACRVTVGGKTKFACVDGPDFDGHCVDWKELFARRNSYFDDETESFCSWEKKNFP